ncbi:hypothetical protein DOY81_005241 [Sarcophaga bullata]|nr:hypothetical protein DOY81_005241 [Sarcophaga bullata]
MSLTIKLIRFEVPKAKSNLIGRVEFRGVAHITSELCSSSTQIDVNQSFIWPLARSANEDEPLIVELRTQTTKTLIKTGLSHASGGLMGGSTATGTITSSSKCIGQYMMLMQGLIHTGFIHVQDQLVDISTSKPIPASILQ